MGLKRFDNGWRFKVGGVNGEPFEFCCRYFSRRGFRVIINLNTDRLIRIFGFNQKVFGV